MLKKTGRAGIFAILILSLSLLSAQNIKPCSAPESGQFDFWIGEWKAEWEGGKGTNTVTKILGGCVIHEEFIQEGESSLIGHSNSVYSIRSGVWKQTWVDNKGGYLDFTGSWQNDKMILSRTDIRDTVSVMQRMVWYDIKEDAFLWNWEISEDNGQTWKINWKISYKRKLD
jgi:hypothetical protein